MVVMPDADPAVLTAGVTSSAFGAAGQRCLAGSLLVLVGDEAEQDAASLHRRRGGRALTVGAGGDPADRRLPAGLGRLRASGSTAEIETALGEGAEAGARRPRCDGGAGGANLGPTIIDDVPAEARRPPPRSSSARS